MNARPGEYANWATGGGAVVSDPEGAKKLVGWTYKEPPPSSEMNWLLRQSYRWQRYLDTLLDFMATGRVEGGRVSYDPAAVVGARFSIAAGSTLLAGGRYAWGAQTFDFDPSANAGPDYRLDAVYCVISYPVADAEPVLTFAYREDLTGFVMPDGGFVVSLQPVAPGVAYAPTDVIQAPVENSSLGGRVVVTDGRLGDAGFAATTPRIQSAIDYLAANGGGVVELRGDKFGALDWALWSSMADTSTTPPLRLKSGVTLEGVHGATIAAPPVALLHDLPCLLRVQGGADAAASTPDAEGYEAGEVETATLVWEDYGPLSRVRIEDGPNAGWYKIAKIKSATRAVLCSLQRVPVALTRGETFAVSVYLTRAGVHNVTFEMTDAASIDGTDGAAIDVQRTFECSLDRVKVYNLTAAADISAGVRLKGGNNYYLTISDSDVAGDFRAGIDGNDASKAQEGHRIIGNRVAVTSGVVLASGIVVASSGAGVGTARGNSVTVPGGAVAESYPALYGERGAPWTVQHEITGDHSALFLGARHIAAECVGDGLQGGAGAAIALKTDGATLTTSGGAAIVAAAGTSTGVRKGNLHTDTAGKGLAKTNTSALDVNYDNATLDVVALTNKLRIKDRGVARGKIALAAVSAAERDAVKACGVLAGDQLISSGSLTTIQFADASPNLCTLAAGVFALTAPPAAPVSFVDLDVKADVIFAPDDKWSAGDRVALVLCVGEVVLGSVVWGEAFVMNYYEVPAATGGSQYVTISGSYLYKAFASNHVAGVRLLHNRGDAASINARMNVDTFLNCIASHCSFREA